jgi:YaaC-like Protein
MKKYTNTYTIGKLPTGFERDLGVSDKFLIRKKKRFHWRHGNQYRTENIRSLTAYHRAVRKHLYYIYGPMQLWYIKRGGNIPELINRCPKTLTFAAMHRLSELARYTPDKLARHFESQHNWVLSEFISRALYQFMDEISAEITRQEFMAPSIRG